MKFIIITLLLLISSISYSQFSSGFNSKEAVDMMALNNSFTFIKIFNSDTAIIPKSYIRLYRSGIFGLDNQYQLWKSDKFAVVSFRGSTAKKSSWLENLYSAMIPATGIMILPGNDKINYKFAKDTAAHIHAGWTLGVLSMVNDLTYHIKNLNRDGIFYIIFTGHSQGGALAHLCRAYFENLPKGIISSKNKFKTYAFASPMPGNKVFAEEYDARFSFTNTSYSFVNPKDMVPKLPITLYNGKLFDPNAIGNLLMNSNSMGSMAGILASRLVSKWFIKNPNAYYIKKAGFDVQEEVEKTIGPFIMPNYCADQSYTPLQKIKFIGPFLNLEKQLEKDSVNMDSLRAIPFYDKNLSIQAGTATQHKPFNYYLYLLKQYYPSRYVATKKRFRVIN